MVVVLEVPVMPVVPVVPVVLVVLVVPVVPVVLVVSCGYERVERWAPPLWCWRVLQVGLTITF